MLEIRLLGQFDVRRDGAPVEILSRPAQSLLAYLLLNPGTPHRREKLAGLLWPDATEANARNYLRKALWLVRKSLAPAGEARAEYLLAGEFSVAFDADSDYWLDAAVLERRADEGVSAQALMEAVSVYRGELLPGFYVEWVVLERERLRAIFEQRMNVLLDRLVAEGRWPDVLEWGERWIALGQTPEPAYRALMVAHSGLGDMSKVASVYERCVQALRNELGVESSEQTRALYECLSRGEGMPVISQPQAPAVISAQVASPERAAPSLPSTLQAHATNLPVPLTSFIGREREIEAIKRLLSTTRLVSLTGPGGSGKTRLANQVATGLVDTFQDGVWWTELVALTDPALVPKAVATALGLREAPNQALEETLAEHLRPRHLLLVLDNCEHLVEACARLAEGLLSVCPNLKILATSREVLEVTGERIFQVPTLSLPDAQHVSQPQLLMQSESVRLFVERAVAVQSDFALAERNAPAVAEVCQRLDGIPLAIELAAARVKMLRVEQIAARLDDRFRLLTSGSRTALPRHQTLRATLDWSYDLLSEVERTMLRGLSVFAGGWTLDAAEAVCAGEGIEVGHVLDLLTQLANKSLVLARWKPWEEARYRLLETIREYAWEKLIEAGEVPLVRDRHLEYFVRLAEEAEPRLFSPEQVIWFSRLEVEHDNLRAAMRWSLDRSAGTAALRLVGALAWFWYTRNHHSEARELSSQILSLPMAAERTAVRAKALIRAGWTQWALGGRTDVRPVLEEALTIANETGDNLNMAWSLVYLGAVTCDQGDYAAGWSLLEQGLARCRQLGTAGRHGVGWALAFLGDEALYQGDYEWARTLYAESVGVLRELSDKNFLAYSLRRLAQATRHLGAYDRATDLCTESLDLNLELGHKQGIAACLAGLAGIALARGLTVGAARMFGAVEAVLQAIATPLMRSDGVDYERNVAAARAQLGDARFQAAWSEGRAMTLGQAMDYALGET